MKANTPKAKEKAEETKRHKQEESIAEQAAWDYREAHGLPSSRAPSTHPPPWSARCRRYASSAVRRVGHGVTVVGQLQLGTELQSIEAILK